MQNGGIANYITAKITDFLFDSLRSEDLPPISVTIPTDRSKADYTTNTAFSLAKRLLQSPSEIAQNIASVFVGDEVCVAEAVSGFVNFRLTDTSILETAKDVISQGKDFGKNHSLQDQTWVIEHTSPNPNKAMHVGHLRNNFVGMSVAALVENSGAKVIRDWIDNDRGIAISKAMWGFLKFMRKNGKETADLAQWIEDPSYWYSPADKDQKPDHFVGACYELGSDDFRTSPEAERQVRQITTAWEAEDKNIRKLWKYIVDLAHTGNAETLRRIGSRWDHSWHEHDHYQQGKNLVEQGIAHSIFKRLPDGAVLTSLESYKLPDTIVTKSDSTSLYVTQDLALTKLKKEHYRADKLIWVVGPEQSLAMKQLFAICEQLGIGKVSDFIHVPYGLVQLASADGARKKMSSRGGGVLLADKLLDQIKNQLLKTDGRDYTPEIADHIAVAALKFAILKPAKNTDIVLSLEQLLNLTGDTGVYVLYTYARTSSLLANAPEDLKITENLTFTSQEHDLLIAASYLPEVAHSAATDLSSSVIAEYLLDVSHKFNALYSQEKFITKNVVKTTTKLLVTRVVKTALNNALRLLNIEPLGKI